MKKAGCVAWGIAVRLDKMFKLVTFVSVKKFSKFKIFLGVRGEVFDSLGNLWKKKSEIELIELLKYPLSEYRTAAAYALKHKKSLSPVTLAEINRLKDTDPRPRVRLGAWKAFELIQEKKDLGE
jgi:hypothetical protein